MDGGEFTELEDLVLNYLIDRWQLGERAIESEQVYKDLLAVGVTIPEWEMHKVLESWRMKRIIQTSRPANSEDVKIHGNVVITWVDTSSM